MCGRFVSSNTPDKIAQFFGGTFEGEQLPENFNVAPTNDVYGVVQAADGAREVQIFHWGLVPSWAKDLKIGSKMINARAETVAEKPSYKRALAKRRCIIPADGFFEWKPVAKGETGGLNKKGPKQPFYIHRPEDEPYAFAWASAMSAGLGFASSSASSAFARSMLLTASCRLDCEEPWLTRLYLACTRSNSTVAS